MSKFLVIILEESVLALNKTHSDWNFTAFYAIFGLDVNGVKPSKS